MSTVSIRIQAGSQQEAEQTKRWLEQQLGESLHLLAPHAGRGAGVRFVRGTLKLALDGPADLIERFMPTGDIPISHLEDIPSDGQVNAALRVIRTIRPDVADLAWQRWDALDAASDREGLDRLAIATVKLAEHLQGGQKGAR